MPTGPATLPQGRYYGGGAVVETSSEGQGGILTDTTPRVVDTDGSDCMDGGKPVHWSGIGSMAGQKQFTDLMTTYAVGTRAKQLGMTAAGTTSATGTVLTADISQISTAPLNSGVVLPAKDCLVFNDGANPIKVYSVNGTIDGTAGATGVTLTNGHKCTYYYYNPNFESAQLGAVSA